MQLSRRNLGKALAAGALTSMAPSLWAQGAFPTRPVTIYVGYPPGGPTDLYLRVLAKHLSTLWSQAVVVENRTGASGSIAAVQVLKAAPDGYSLLFTNNATNGAYELLNAKTAQYRTLRDFAPVALFGVAPNMLVVRASLPVKDAREFVALAKASPGKYTYGSSAIGSSPHLASELLQISAGIKLLHVPFNGAGPVMQALLGDTIDMYIGAASTVMPQVKSGKLRALAVAHRNRVPSAPDVPTLAEQGFAGAEYSSWFGVLASAQMPAALLDQINADCRKVMELPEMKAQLEQFGVDYTPSSRQQFLALVKEDGERAGKIIAQRNITAE